MFVQVPDTAVALSGTTTIAGAGLVQDCSAPLLLNVGVKPSAHMQPDPAWLTTALAMDLQLLRLFATHFCSGVVERSVVGVKLAAHTHDVRASLATELAMLQGKQMPPAIGL
jgi:hypothetical protein